MSSSNATDLLIKRLEMVREIRKEVAGLASIITFWDYDTVPMSSLVVKTKIESMERAITLSDELDASMLSRHLRAVQNGLEVFMSRNADGNTMNLILSALKDAGKLIDRVGLSLYFRFDD